jgi:hypothetical protein
MANKNSRIIARADRNGNLRTETVRRDSGLDLAITTDRNNSTRVFIDMQGRDAQIPFPSLELNGNQARTLYVALQRHFRAQRKATVVA